MKITPILLLLYCLTSLSSRSAAQQYYSFEEACRMAGNTTGACAPKSQQETPLDCRKLAGNAFHPEKLSGGRCKDVTLSEVIDFEIFVEMIGLPNISKINDMKLTIGRSVGIQNAMATFYSEYRIIIFNPQWAKSATAEAYLILGHEAGHHFCGHPLDGDPIGHKERELEADRFSGAAIKRFEEYHGKPFLQEAFEAAMRLYTSPESSSHPSQAARLEAIKLGYNSDSPCGNLSAGVRGHTAGPR